MSVKGNILGDIRAEADIDMLSQAFFETSDYRSLLESSDRCVIVGRRGTGKSALAYKLEEHWSKEKKTFVVNIAPQEDQIIGLRGMLTSFGENFIHIKAGAKIAWKYALYMEIVTKFNNHYKLKSVISKTNLGGFLKRWGPHTQNISSKLRATLQAVLDNKKSAEQNIAELSNNLNIDEIEHELYRIFEDRKDVVVLLIDRLDEGYTPDGMGVALVDGFVQAVIDLNTKYKMHVKGIVFLRDNMYRSISKKDPDFTRNIEGQVLRLHWDEYSLFNMVCNRIRIAHNNTQENNTRLWNQYTARHIKDREGFKYCLRLTLYRPRDILVLLNNAFLHAASQSREQIVDEDIDSSAKSISDNRLNDLEKEYESIFPALRLFTSGFTSGPAHISIGDARTTIEKILSKDDHEIDMQRDLVVFENANQVLQRLYGIGFIGLYDEKAGSYVFCHDGKDPDKEVSSNSKILIHPCYWLALNLSEKQIDEGQAEDIYDEYDIEFSSISSEQRLARIGQVIEEVKGIELGKAGCVDFEDWCLQAIKFIFAGALTNIELHPNKNGRQQRDIVATNMGTVPVWSRILNDYNSRQIIFEVKNYSDLSEDEYRQMNTYLCNDYGSLGFIICRCENNNLEKGKELDWAQELYFNQGKKIVIKLSERFLTKHLSKIRSPQKHDAANIELNKLIDTYLRQYLILKAK
jgi:hypothetical protein